MLAGVNGAFLTGDIFNLYVWFEVFVISSFGLLILGSERRQIDGAVKYAVLNLIPYNTVDDLPYRRPSWERAAAMARHLHRLGILTKLRHSAGQDVEGGCGQLRARAQRPERPARRVIALQAV